MKPLSLALLLAITAAPIAVQAKPTETNAAQEALAEAVGPMAESHLGVVTLAFKHLGTGQTFEIDADRPMPSASLIKLPIMVAAYEAAARGALSLDDPVTLTEEDQVGGSGLLTSHFSPGVQLPLRDAIRLMIGWSDNTATNLVIDAIGKAAAPNAEDPTKPGIEAVNALMERLGYDGLRLNSKVFRRDVTVNAERSEEFGLGMMTAGDTAALCERLVTGDPFGSGEGAGHGEADAAAVKAMGEEMMDHLRACQSDSMAPRLLPDGAVAHKTGSVSRVRCDGGVIETSTGPITYCVMTADNDDTSWGPDAAPHLLVGKVVKSVYTYFTEGPGAVEAPRVARVLRMGVDDPLVEHVQRTLNRRLKAGPKLGVDGDFGPNTRRAVENFQRQEKLEVTGEVDGPTWNALGPLVMEDDPVPPPEEVMKDLAPLKPQDPLTGPPVVSCAAWAIADGENGKLLWGYNDSAVRDPASTTKTMTAWLVLRLAEEDPSVLDEVIVFSKRADETTGSTSAVRAGEKVSAGELLYGLMLPSGNDASVALAEHFGDRFPGEAGQSNYDRFVAAMNAEAERLGMNETGYRNTHGLTDEGHVTSARDLVKLAHAAMQNETFREVVAARRRGVTLDSVAGYKRNAVWNNTDRLLNYEGFYGVKTGTTGPAGACLISAGKRGDRPLYVVILGATSSDGRYVDARNLYRWAWKELGVE